MKTYPSELIFALITPLNSLSTNSHSMLSMSDLFQDHKLPPTGITKSVDAQVSYIKWYTMMKTVGPLHLGFPAMDREYCF